MSSEASLPKKNEKALDEAHRLQDSIVGLSSFSEMSLEGVDIITELETAELHKRPKSTSVISLKRALFESSPKRKVNDKLYLIKSKVDHAEAYGDFFMTLLKVELEHFQDESSSISDMVSNIIATHKGSLYLQGLLIDLPKESLFLLYKSIKQEYLDFLTKPYSNYFCQQLFFFLEIPERINLIKNLVPRILDLVKGSKGRCSVIFILENMQTEEEKQLVIKLLEPQLFSNYIWDPKFMRIGESLIGTYPRASIQPIIDFIVNNLAAFLKIREGYYLLRTVVKHLKSLHEQLNLISIIEQNFLEVAKSFNGSLLLQCIIHNFPISTYNYTKSSISCVNNNGASKINNEKMKKVNNKALEALYNILIQHSNEWDNNKVKAIVECAIKFGTNEFGSIYLNNLNKTTNTFMKCSYSVKIMKIMIKSFERGITLSIFKNISQQIKYLDASKQEKWSKLYNQFIETSKLKPTLYSNSSLSTLESNGSNKKTYSTQCKLIKIDNANPTNKKQENHNLIEKCNQLTMNAKVSGLLSNAPVHCPLYARYYAPQIISKSQCYFLSNNVPQQMPIRLISDNSIPTQMNYLDHNNYINMGYIEPLYNLNYGTRSAGFYHI